MPLKVNVGLCKKIGLPDYGSLGASCNLEFEMDAGLLASDLDGFHARIKDAYLACRQAVQDELFRAESRKSADPSLPPFETPPATPIQPRSNGNSRGSAAHRASQKQLDYVGQLAGQVKELGPGGLERLSQRMFQKPVTELSSLDASGLIDTLKDIKAGKIQLPQLGPGAAA